MTSINPTTIPLWMPEQWSSSGLASLLAVLVLMVMARQLFSVGLDARQRADQLGRCIADENYTIVRNAFPSVTIPRHLLALMPPKEMNRLLRLSNRLPVIPMPVVEASLSLDRGSFRISLLPTATSSSPAFNVAFDLTAVMDMRHGFDRVVVDVFHNLPVDQLYRLLPRSTPTRLDSDVEQGKHELPRVHPSTVLRRVLGLRRRQLGTPTAIAEDPGKKYVDVPLDTLKQSPTTITRTAAIASAMAHRNGSVDEKMVDISSLMSGYSAKATQTFPLEGASASMNIHVTAILDTEPTRPQPRREPMLSMDEEEMSSDEEAVDSGQAPAGGQASNSDPPVPPGDLIKFVAIVRPAGQKTASSVWLLLIADGTVPEAGPVVPAGSIADGTAPEAAPTAPVDSQRLSLTAFKQFLVTDNMTWELEDIYGSSTSSTALNDPASEAAPAPTESQLCVICLTDPSKIAILPCRHCCLCASCWTGDDASPSVAGSMDAPLSPARSHVSGITRRASESARNGDDDLQEAPAASFAITSCPVCRGNVGAWIEMRSTSAAVTHLVLSPKSIS